MFSRRHPYLFFILVFSGIFAFLFIVLSLTFVIGFKSSDLDFGEKVGVVVVTGPITDSQDIIQSIKRFREDDTIKAIVLRIDSPGGGVGPSQEIFTELMRTKKDKKVIASMGGVAASGGYYIAAGTDGIVANPGTITGSIGVILGFTNIEELLKKIGLSPVVIKSGEYKDMGSPVRQLTSKERGILTQFANRIHRQFISAIVEGRGMDVKKVEEIADGRIFSGEEAKEYGLVDRMGNLEDAIEWAGRLGGIKGKVSAVYAPEKKFILKYLAETSAKEFLKHIMYQDIFSGYLYRPETD